MFEWLTKVKLYETMNQDKKVRLEQLLIENNIEYTIDIDDLHHRNAFDAADIGHLIGKPKNVYIFWVNRKVKEEAFLLMKRM